METGSLRTGASTAAGRPLPLPILLLVLLLPGWSAAQADSAERAREVKAAFVLNIARFVYWPEEVFAEHPREIRLCLYRGNPLGNALETIRNKRVVGRDLTISNIDRLGENGSCNILLVPSEQLDQFRRDPDRIPEQPMLTITDGTVAATDTRGIQVILMRRETRIGFDIDQTRVQRSGLRLSSELLKLGRIIHRAQ